MTKPGINRRSLPFPGPRSGRTDAEKWRSVSRLMLNWLAPSVDAGTGRYCMKNVLLSSQLPLATAMLNTVVHRSWGAGPPLKTCPLKNKSDWSARVWQSEEPHQFNQHILLLSQGSLPDGCCTTKFCRMRVKETFHLVSRVCLVIQIYLQCIQLVQYSTFFKFCVFTLTVNQRILLFFLNLMQYLPKKKFFCGWCTKQIKKRKKETKKNPTTTTF